MYTSWIARGLMVASLLGIAAAAGANEPYPSRPVKVVANMAAGGGTDTIARILSQRISKELGQPIVVENRAGAAGQIGTETSCGRTC